MVDNINRYLNYAGEAPRDGLKEIVAIELTEEPDNRVQPTKVKGQPVTREF